MPGAGEEERTINENAWLGYVTARLADVRELFTLLWVAEVVHLGVGFAVLVDSTVTDFVVKDWIDK
jgi:hypothetical protein